MSKLIKFLIGIWLLIGVAGLALSIYHLFNKNYRDAMYFAGIIIVSVIMFFINKRRYNMYVKDNASSPKK
ncbi:MAG: hypothetical protein IT239_03125 [Bacteroidia bacterium]|nr:hypothetical protein [Bacteroidia bacterium]